LTSSIEARFNYRYQGKIKRVRSGSTAGDALAHLEGKVEEMLRLS
jgi:hypothetical protein